MLGFLSYDGAPQQILRSQFPVAVLPVAQHRTNHTPQLRTAGSIRCLNREPEVHSAHVARERGRIGIGREVAFCDRAFEPLQQVRLVPTSTIAHLGSSWAAGNLFKALMPMKTKSAATISCVSTKGGSVCSGAIA